MRRLLGSQVEKAANYKSSSNEGYEIFYFHFLLMARSREVVKKIQGSNAKANPKFKVLNYWIFGF